MLEVPSLALVQCPPGVLVALVLIIQQLFLTIQSISTIYLSDLSVASSYSADLHHSHMVALVGPCIAIASVPGLGHTGEVEVATRRAF
jgi:hypothetical protein